MIAETRGRTVFSGWRAKHNFIVDVHVAPGNVSDSTVYFNQLNPILERSRSPFDAVYFTTGIAKTLAERRTSAGRKGCSARQGTRNGRNRVLISVSRDVLPTDQTMACRPQPKVLDFVQSSRVSAPKSKKIALQNDLKRYQLVENALR